MKGALYLTKQERSWILQDFANSAYSIIITTAILPVFFKEVASKGLEPHTSTAYWGYANFLSTLIISILAPFLGALADYKGYKKKLFTLFTLIGILATSSLAMIGNGSWLSCLLIYIITVIGFTGSTIFYDSFLTDVTDNENMDMISSLGFAWGYIGGTIPFIASIVIILRASSLGISTLLATQLSFIITALWWLIFTIPMIKNVHQIYYVEPDLNYIKKSVQRLWTVFKDIKKSKNVFLFLLAFFFYIDGVHTIISMATAYGIDIGLSSSTLMIVLVVLQIVAFPCAIIYGKLAKIFSTRAMILVGILTYSIVAIYGFFIKTAFDYWILAILVGSAQGGIQALSRSYFGKLIPKENSGEYFGIYNIFGRISSAFGPLIMALVSTITKNSRYGVLSITILFVIGGLIFMNIDDTETTLFKINKS